jgi:hypothetical protein
MRELGQHVALKHVETLSNIIDRATDARALPPLQEAKNILYDFANMREEINRLGCSETGECYTNIYEAKKFVSEHNRDCLDIIIVDLLLNYDVMDNPFLNTEKQPRLFEQGPITPNQYVKTNLTISEFKAKLKNHQNEDIPPWALQIINVNNNFKYISNDQFDDDFMSSLQDNITRFAATFYMQRNSDSHEWIKALPQIITERVCLAVREILKLVISISETTNIFIIESPGELMHVLIPYELQVPHSHVPYGARIVIRRNQNDIVGRFFVLLRTSMDSTPNLQLLLRIRRDVKSDKEKHTSLFNNISKYIESEFKLLLLTSDSSTPLPYTDNFKMMYSDDQKDIQKTKRMAEKAIEKNFPEILTVRINLLP